MVPGLVKFEVIEGVCSQIENPVFYIGVGHRTSFVEQNYYKTIAGFVNVTITGHIERSDH